MSTKITIAYSKRKGKDFHLYKECFENDGSVYLELRHPEYYVASPDRVVVKISKKIFNEILKVKT